MLPGLHVGHDGITLELILVISGFKKYWVAYMRVPLFFTDVAL